MPWPGRRRTSSAQWGQHWGNPLFDWDALAKQGYRWWIERLRRTFSLYDLARIDHFRGFAAFWAIPEGPDELDARTGRWLPGPGESVFRAAEAELGELPVIAEDLGVITKDVEVLRDALGFPGMVVLLWAFQGPASNPHRLENHRVHQVIYTTTHDTDTLLGHMPDREPWQLIELALSSRAAVCMIPAQDVLGLGSEGRMNTPGVRYGNWTWRLEPGQLTDELAERLRVATAGAAPAAGSGRLDRQGGRHRAPPADLVDHVDDVVLPVRARDPERDRRPAPEAELALLVELACEDERSRPRRGSRLPHAARPR